MSVVQFSAACAGNGRFAPGVSGNPAGRPKGSKNRSTLLMASLGEADVEAVVAAAVAKAKAGDGAMLRCLVTRILPAVRSRPVELAVPDGREADLRALHDATLKGLAQGEILPDEALMIARALEKMARALAVAATAASPSRRRSPRPARARKPHAACKSPVSRGVATPSTGMAGLDPAIHGSPFPAPEAQSFPGPVVAGKPGTPGLLVPSCLGGQRPNLNHRDTEGTKERIAAVPQQQNLRMAGRARR